MTCANLIDGNKCLFRESEIQGSDLLRNLPCLVKHGFRCIWHEQAVIGTKVKYKDPAKMSDATLEAHISQTCPDYPCDRGCKVINETLDKCRNYTVPKTPIGIIKDRVCECGQLLKPRHQFCDDCKKKRLKDQWKKASKKRRKDDEGKSV